MNLYLAVTDKDWFRFLRSRPDLDEANFWQPGGGRHLRQLQPGAPFLFKLHAPEHFIAGGGAVRPLGEGHPPRPGLGDLRREERGRDEEWIPSGPYWSKGTRQGHYLDLSEGAGAELWREVQLRLAARIPVADEVAEPTPMYGDPVLHRPRMGQGGVRFSILDTYHRRCAVTGEKALPVLDAAHIRGVQEGGQHRLDNGLLLRSDVHRLFDAGYVTVTPERRTPPPGSSTPLRSARNDKMK